MEGKDLEEHLGVFQEGHPGQVQDRGGKEGTEHLQEAKHRNVYQTRSRKDQENAFSQLSMGRRTQEEQSALPEKQPADSRTSTTSKDKKDTCGRKAPQKDAGSQASRYEPQLSEAPGPKRKDRPSAQRTTG